ncbi:MAG: ketopantoate reductase family protein [bacterium]|nr:ketopantoate reductase family protein [bacterium]
MKALIFGAGPLGSLYAYLLHKAGKDVTILARNAHYDFIKSNGIVLVNEFSGEKASADVKVVDKLEAGDSYDLVLVFVRKNKLGPVIQDLSGSKNLKNIVFMGNNALGFEEYFQYLPRERVLFGFGRAGGGRKNHVVHYVDSEKPGGKRMPVIIGEYDGKIKERTNAIKRFLESAQIPVELNRNIDGWFKYHLALVIPMCASLLKHDCNNYRLAENKEDIRTCLRAFKEAGNVVRDLGYKRQPFKLNLFYWMPEFLVAKILQGILKSKFAEIAFALHARAAVDEFGQHAEDFKSLARQAGVETPYMDKLNIYLTEQGGK